MMRTAVTLVAVLAVAAPSAPARGAEPGPAAAGAATVREAIVAAVIQRFGTEAAPVVTVTGLRTSVEDAPGLVAIPDPGARTGRPVQFAIRSGARRAGSAVARIGVAVRHLRAVVPVSRDATIGADEIEEVDGDVPGVWFAPLPQRDDVVSARARRAIAPGEILSHALVAVPDAVRAGDEVRAVVRAGTVEAWGAGRASSSGRVGKIVRITRPGAPGLRRARVLAPGVVQVLLPESQEIR